MIKKLLLTSAIVLIPLFGIAKADNFYGGVEGGSSFADVDVSKEVNQPTSPFTKPFTWNLDDSPVGYNVGAFFGYEKNLNFGLYKQKGNDTLRFEGLVGYRGYDYSSSSDWSDSFKLGKKNFELGLDTHVDADISSVSFLPGVHYDAKSLSLVNNDNFKLYPTVGMGLGFSYNKIDNINGSVGSSAKLGGLSAKNSVDYSVDGDSNLDFAWYVGAGLRADINKDWSADVGYRYVDLGSVTTGSKLHVNGTSTKIDPVEADLTAHELLARVSYRFNLPVK